MKKIFTKKTIVTLSFPAIVWTGVLMPQQIVAESLLTQVVAGVVRGMYDRPQYQDDRPYYFYNNRYYYGGEWRDGFYYYEGRRLSGGHYYRQGYAEHYGRDYKNPNYKNGYYKHNKHYQNEHQYEERYRHEDRYEKYNDHAPSKKSHKGQNSNGQKGKKH